ncbi:class I SAM-dependent methyltransferase [Mucilaginibacter sp.]
MNTLQQRFGNIDIYLFDQLLKGRFDDCRTVIDIGCGGGRNLLYFMRNGYQVFGIDPNPEAIAAVRALAAETQNTTAAENFVIAAAEAMPFADATFDLAICSAVLHFAGNEAHFKAMLQSAWRVLKPGGYFFARLASDIGIEDAVLPLGNRRFLLPDGSERFLVNEAMLMDYTTRLGGQLFEPLKTTNVQNLRCMTTWCLQKI